MSDKETLLKEARDGYLELQQSIAGLDEARAGEPWLGAADLLYPDIEVALTPAVGSEGQ